MVGELVSVSLRVQTELSAGLWLSVIFAGCWIAFV
jgi:hypothetical protein